ncbi:hypothetical protein [Bradyrhizobium sp. LB11.1]|uniref:hypothetical protein n=1 Tax=Bradyrhizobium sp. LB11.1 TaxID=3156326 RepID=UPI0033962852
MPAARDLFDKKRGTVEDDDSPSPSSGHFVVNGATVPAQTAYAVTAAQLAQTTFVAESNGTSDDLYVKAFDGQAYSVGREKSSRPLSGNRFFGRDEL